jgi:tetratricopeptide (TPR) repeat protein
VQYLTGSAALNAGKLAQAKTYFDDLYRKKYDNPAIYESLYNIFIEEDLNKAYSFLEKGRALYPDDVALLFAEINHFLKTNRLNELISKLELAIAKEPENVSLYFTLGNVNDHLYLQERSAGNSEKATEYFSKAMENYQAAISKNPEYFDALYNIGALHYNLAANLTQDLIEMQNDTSSEGQKKLETKRAEALTHFEKALPYFQKVEALNPNDVSTLTAYMQG